MLTAAMALLGAITMVAYFTPVDPPLRVVVPTLALGLVMLLGGRWRLRVWLGRQRNKGRFLCKTLLVGERLRHASLAEAFAGDVTSGFKAIGAVQPPRRGAGVGDIEDWLDNVMRWIADHDVRAVAVVESATVDVEVLRRLAWRLEAPRIDLLVSPMLLSDVAGPRISVRPAAGLPLIHLDEPTLTGPKRVLKRTLDLVLTVPALILLSPLFALIAIAIRLDSPGRVFYVSERVGRSGVVFGCLKFRTMCAGADCLRGEVIGVPDDDIVTRYQQDPRVTRVGHVLRRWSLDELPQLLNVAAGSMSLVGPRPMLPEEMGLLADVDHRRHLAKPGITGLWQISGRKEVAWEDRMRMDLYYLERWSVALDIVILLKTVKAVVSAKGAY